MIAGIGQTKIKKTERAKHIPTPGRAPGNERARRAPATVAVGRFDHPAAHRARDRVSHFLPANYIEAEDRLDRTLATVTEHATKVFETFEITSIYVDELIGNVSDEEIRLAELRYHERLKRLTTTLPQLRDVFVIDPDGHPLVSGTVYPMNYNIDLSGPGVLSLSQDQRAHRQLSDGRDQIPRGRAQPLRDSRQRQFRGEKMPFAASSPRRSHRTISSITMPAWRKRRTTRSGSFARTGPSSPGTRRSPSDITQLPASGPWYGDPPGHQTYGGRRLARRQRAADLRLSPTAAPGRGRAGGCVDGRHHAPWSEGMSYHLIFGVPATLGLVALCSFAVVQARREPPPMRSCARKRSLRRAPSRRCARRRRWRRSAGSPAASRTTSTIC